MNHLTHTMSQAAYPPIPHRQLGASAQSPQQHHLQAAEHLSKAAAQHQETARHHASGDGVSAAQKARAAAQHTATAAGHARQAMKQ